MKMYSFKGEGGNSEPADDLGSLFDVAQDVDTSGSPQNDPASTISADNGEVIQLDDKPTHTK
jgi:hypothetical protein